MIWLTWRQFRISALTLFGVLGAVAVALALTGPGLAREYADLRATCGGDACDPEAFDDFFVSHLIVYLGLMLLVMAVPVVVGVFLGAPLISREFETGTQDLVWQQSVPRRRWLAVKLGVVGLAAMAAAGLAVVAVSWWSSPLDAVTFGGVSRLGPVTFDARGFTVLGQAAFGLTFGAAAGLLIRRTLPAMAVTFLIRRHAAALDRRMRCAGRTLRRSRPTAVLRPARCRRLPAGRDLSPGGAVLAVPGLRDGHLRGAHPVASRALLLSNTAELSEVSSRACPAAARPFVPRV